MPRNNNYNYQTPTQNSNDDRFIVPFLVGGVAGTALGYGLANNNNQAYYPYPPYYYPNNFYGAQPYPVYYPRRW